MNTIESMNKFNVEKKPEALSNVSRGRFKELLIALSNLANDKCITMSLVETNEMFAYNLPIELKKLRAALYQVSKTAKLRACVEISNGTVYFFTRR